MATNYDLYLQQLKNKYNSNTDLEENEVNALTTRKASLDEAFRIRKMNDGKTINNVTSSGNSLKDAFAQREQTISDIAQQNDIAWSNEYEKESLNWWEQVGAWIIQAKNTIAETFIKMGTENLIDAGALVGAMFMDAVGDTSASENIRNFVKMDLTGDLMFNQEWFRQADNVLSGTGIFDLGGDKASKFAHNDEATQDWVKNIAQGIGSSLGFAALTSIPYVGWGLAATSVGGAGAEEALKEGANAEQAFAYGLGSAAVESITELTVGKILNLVGKGGGKVLSKLTGKEVSGKIANDIVGGIGTSYGKSIVANLIKNFNEEGMEEVVSDLVNPILKMIYKECDSEDFFGKYGELFEENGGWEGLLESYFYGGLSAGIMEGVNLGVRAGRYGSIKAVQFENSVAEVVDINDQLRQEIEKNDFNKYPNLEDNPKIQQLLKQKQFLQEKIGNDFKEWLDTVKQDFLNNQSARNERKEGLRLLGQEVLDTNTRDIVQSVGKETIENLGYEYKESDKNATDFKNRIVYVNGKQTFNEYFKTVLHEATHIASVEKGIEKSSQLTKSIIESMTKTAYEEEFNKQLKLQTKNFFQTKEGKEWLKNNGLTLKAYNELSLSEKAKIDKKIGVENKEWFDEEVAAEHLVDSMTSFKQFNKAIKDIDSRGLRKILNAIKKAFGNKKDKPKNYDEIVKALQDGIKNSKINKDNITSETRAKFREVEKIGELDFEDDEFDSTDEDIKAIDALMSDENWNETLTKDYEKNEKSYGDIMVENNLKPSDLINEDYISDEFTIVLNELLSTKVKEYFKDSVIKSDRLNRFDGKKDGKYLIPMFHGTPNSDMYFFDSKRMGTNGTARGFGFYLTNSLSYANGYTKGKGKVITAFVNITNPMNEQKITITRNQLAEFIRKYADPTGDDYLSAFGDVYADYEGTLQKALDNLFKYNTSDVQLINEIYAVAKPNYDEYFNNVTKFFGFDGIVYKNLAEGTIVIAFRSNQIKDINNTAPTESEDIRYRESGEDSEKDSRVDEEQLQYDSTGWYKFDKESRKNYGHWIVDWKTKTQVYVGAKFIPYGWGDTLYERAYQEGLNANLINDIFSGEKGIFGNNEKDNLRQYIDILSKLNDKGYKTLDSKGNIESDFLSPEMNMLIDEYRRFGGKDIYYSLNYNDKLYGGYEANNFTLNLPLIVEDGKNILETIRHERTHLFQDKCYYDYEKHERKIFDLIISTPGLYDELFEKDPHGRSYFNEAYKGFSSEVPMQQAAWIYTLNIFRSRYGYDFYKNNYAEIRKNANAYAEEYNEHAIVDEIIADTFSFKEKVLKIYEDYGISREQIKKIVDEYREDFGKKFNSEMRFREVEDSDGEYITPQMAKWNEGNKFTDEEGRILKLYHGTPLGGFMEFGDNKPIFLTPVFENAYSYGGNYNLVNTTRYTSAKELINDFYENTSEADYYQDLVKISDDEQAQEDIDRLIAKWKEQLNKPAKNANLPNLVDFKIKALNEAKKNGYMAYADDGADFTIYETEEELLYSFQIDNQYDKNLSEEETDDEYDPKGNRIYALYAKAKNPLIIECRGNNFLNIRYKGETLSTDAIAEKVKAEGKYDGIIFKNIMDNGALDRFNELGLSDVYVVFNANQVKAVDNPAPTESTDIRYREVESIEDNDEFNLDNEETSQEFERYLLNAELPIEIQNIIDNFDEVEDSSAKLENSLKKLVKKIRDEFATISKELKAEKPDNKVLADNKYQLVNDIRTALYFSDLIDIYDSRNAKNALKVSTNAFKEYQKISGKLEELIGSAKATQVENVNVSEAQEEAEEQYNEERQIINQALKDANINVKTITTNVKQFAQSTKKIFAQITDLPNPIRENTIEKRYNNLVAPIDLLISTYQDYLNKTTLSEEQKARAMELFKDDLYGGRRLRASRENKVNQAREQYNNLTVDTTEKSLQKVLQEIMPISEPKIVVKEKTRIINNARKIAMPELAGIKAQADLRLDGKVYTLNSINQLTKVIESTLKNSKVVGDMNFRIEYEGTTREIKATEIAMILNEYNNTKYVKNDSAINYSNLTNQDKIDRITNILVDGIVFDYNGTDTIKNDRLSDYVKAGDTVAITIKEYIRNQVTALVNNEGETSKVAKLLARQEKLFKKQISSLKERVSTLSEKIVKLNKQIKDAKDDKTVKKLQKQLDKLTADIETRKKENAKYRKELKQAYTKINNLVSKNQYLTNLNEYYRRKNIELYTDSHGVVKLNADSVKTLKELGRAINPDFTMSMYVTNEIANAISKKNFDRAFDLYANALLNSDYVDGEQIIPYSELISIQSELYADEYLENGESRDIFQQDMDIIKNAIIEIFEGSEISSKQKMLDRLAKLQAFNDNIRLKLRETRTTLSAYKQSAMASDTAKRVYARLITKNEQGKSRSGNRYGGLDPRYVEMVRDFARGTDDTVGLNKLTAKRIANKEFIPGLKLFYDRYQDLTQKGVIKFEMSEQLEQYIKYVLDESNATNGKYIATYKKVLNGINRLVEQEVKTRKERFGNIEGSIAELSQRMQDETRLKPDEKQMIFDFVQGFITPKAFFERASGYNHDTVFYQIYEELFNAEMKRQSVELDLRSPFNEFEKNKDYKQFYKSLNKETTIEYGGKTIKADKAQFLTLYEAFKREQSLEHITNKLGGIQADGKLIQFENFEELQDLIDNIEKEYDLKNENSINYKFIKAVEQMFNKARKYKMVVDILRLGFTNVEDGFYFPIAIADADKQHNISSADFFKTSMPGATNYSFNQNTTGTMGAIQLNSILDIVQRHINQMATYAGYGVVTDNISKLWNYKLSEGKTVAQAVKSRYTYETSGKVEKYLATLLNDVQQIGSNGQSNTDSFFKKIVNKLRGNVANVALGANPKVMFSQVASIPAAMRYIKARNLVKGLKSGFGIGIGNGSLPPKPDMFIYRQQTNQIAQAETQGTIQNTSNLLSKGINAFDTYAINTIWVASLYQTRNADGTWNIEEATKLAQKTVFDTQPNYIALGRSEFLRSKNDFVKLFTMFQSQAQQNLSTLYTAINRIIYKKRHGIRLSSGDWEELGKSLLALFIQAIVYTGMNELFKHIVNNDWGENKSEEEATNFAVDFFNDNIMGMIPILNNIELDLTAKWKVNFNNLSAGFIDNYVNMLQNFDGSLSAKEINTNISYMFGLPLTNVYKWSKALAQYIPGAEDYVQSIDLAYRGKELNKSAVTKASTKSLTRTYYRLFTKKYVDIQSETLSKMYNLYSLGYNDVILKDIPSSYTNNGVDVKIDYNEFLKEYGKVGSQLDKIVKSSQFKALDEEKQAKVLSKTINTYYNASKKLITGDKMNMLETLAYFNKNVDVNTLLAIIEASDIESDSKNTKKQNITKYINSLRMTKANKYFIYAALGYSVDSSYYQRYLTAVLGLNRMQIKLLNL